MAVYANYYAKEISYEYQTHVLIFERWKNQTWYASAFIIIWYGTSPSGWISLMRTLAGIIWKLIKSRNVPTTSVKLWFVESQYFLLQRRAAWNLTNSSAFNSSRDMISLTICCGNNVNDPKLNTSFPWSSTNSRTYIIISNQYEIKTFEVY